MCLCDCKRKGEREFDREYPRLWTRVCACVCVCVFERERESQLKWLWESSLVDKVSVGKQNFFCVLIFLIKKVFKEYFNSI